MYFGFGLPDLWYLGCGLLSLLDHSLLRLLGLGLLHLGLLRRLGNGRFGLLGIFDHKFLGLGHRLLGLLGLHQLQLRIIVLISHGLHGVFGIEILGLFCGFIYHGLLGFLGYWPP